MPIERQETPKDAVPSYPVPPKPEEAKPKDPDAVTPADEVADLPAPEQPQYESEAQRLKRENVNVDVPELPKDVTVRLAPGNESVNIVSVAGNDFDFSESSTIKVDAPTAALLTDPALGRLPDGDPEDGAVAAVPIVEIVE